MTTQIDTGDFRYAKQYCPKCDGHQYVLIEATEDEPTTIPCDDCDQTGEITNKNIATCWAREDDVDNDTSWTKHFYFFGEGIDSVSIKDLLALNYNVDIVGSGSCGCVHDCCGCVGYFTPQIHIRELENGSAAAHVEVSYFTNV